MTVEASNRRKENGRRRELSGQTKADHFHRGFCDAGDKVSKDPASELPRRREGLS